MNKKKNKTNRTLAFLLAAAVAMSAYGAAGPVAASDLEQTDTAIVQPVEEPKDSSEIADGQPSEIPGETQEEPTEEPVEELPGETLPGTPTEAEKETTPETPAEIPEEKPSGTEQEKEETREPATPEATEGDEEPEGDLIPEITKEEAKEKVTDAVIEVYIREHINTSYMQAEKMELANALLVKNTLADGSKISGSPTIDAIMYREDFAEVVIAMINAVVPVYNLDDDSDYLVAYADTMGQDDTATVRDTIFALTNNAGQVVTNCHYDYKTGLAYIPKSIYLSENETNKFYELQVQVLQVISPKADDVMKAASSVAVTTEEKRTVTQDVEAVGVFEMETTVETQAGLPQDEMVVSVNGIPLDEESYEYNSRRGEITIAQSSASVQSVSIEVEEKGIADKIKDAFAPITAHAKGFVSVDEMRTIGKAVVPADIAVGSYYAGNLMYMYKDTQSGFDGAYGIGADNHAGDVVITDPLLEDLAQLIYYGGTLDTTKITQENTYTYISLDLPNSQIPGITFKETPIVRQQCAHISNPIGSSGNAGSNKFELVRGAVRVLGLNRSGNNPYMLVGILTATTHTQGSAGIYKIGIQPQEVDIGVTKYDAYTAETVPGATFTLYGWNAATKQYDRKIGNFAQNGESYLLRRVDPAKGDDGYFLIKEEKAPEGYSNRYWMNDDMDQYEYGKYGGRQVRWDSAAGTWKSVNNVSSWQAFIDPLLVQRLVINKVIRREDIWWAHGEPSFLFRVSGTDIHGNTHTYHRVVTYSRAYVEANTAADGSIKISTAIPRIPSGSYDVEELKVSRFGLVDVTAQTDNIAITKKATGNTYEGIKTITATVRADLTAKDGEVTFFNRKITWDKFSHKDEKINKFAIQR